MNGNLCFISAAVTMGQNVPELNSGNMRNSLQPFCVRPPVVKLLSERYSWSSKLHVWSTVNVYCALRFRHLCNFRPFRLDMFTKQIAGNLAIKTARLYRVPVPEMYTLTDIIPWSHSYCLSLSLCPEWYWYNESITPRVHSGVTKQIECKLHYRPSATVE